MEYTIVYLKPSNIFTKYLHRVHLDDKVMHPKQGNNVWCIKIRTNLSTVSLLCLVRILMHQTLIQVMPCFLGKAEGVSRGIAVAALFDMFCDWIGEALKPFLFYSFLALKLLFYKLSWTFKTFSTFSLHKNLSNKFKKPFLHF